MENYVKVDLDQIERIFALVVAEMRQQNGSWVPIAGDYYWSIPLGHLMDVYSAPPTLGIGQASECLEWLDNLEKDPTKVLPYDLTVLGDILRALGDSLAPDFSIGHQTET